MDSYTTRVRGLVQLFYANDAQRCFPQGSRGTVIIRFTIEADGAVRNPAVIHDTTGDSRVGACLVRQARSWQLPAPPRAQPMAFSLTFAQ